MKHWFIRTSAWLTGAGRSFALLALLLALLASAKVWAQPQPVSGQVTEARLGGTGRGLPPGRGQ